MEVSTPKNIDDLIKRWEQVDRVLKDLSPHEKRKHWNMSQWGVKNECGTTACAAGHCGMDPWFRRRGLRLRFERYGPYSHLVDDAFGDDVSDFFTPSREVVGEDLHSIAWWGVSNIFYDGADRSVGTVRKEIKEYLKSLRAFKEREEASNPSRQGTV